MRCKVILEMIEPYVRVKKESVRLAFEFIDTIRGDFRGKLSAEELERKMSIATQMRALTAGNHRRLEVR